MKNFFHKKTDFSLALSSGYLLHPEWVTGIIDSEGNLSITVQKINNSIKISLLFKVTQKNHSMGILLDLQNYFGCGNIHIDNKTANANKFSITRLEDIITKVIPHLDKYPLITSKNLDFQDWKKVAFMIQDKLHLKKEFQTEILSIKENMNSLRNFEERWNFVQKSKPIVLSNEWVQAFVDGEGSFQFTISNTVNRGKPYVSLTPTLEVAQSNHDVGVLHALVQFFNNGYIKPKYDINDLNSVKNSRSVNRFIINQHDVVIQFFDKYTLLTQKYLDYLSWKELIELKSNNVHKTPEGLKKMQDIKNSMNKGRK